MNTLYELRQQCPTLKTSKALYRYGSLWGDKRGNADPVDWLAEGNGRIYNKRGAACSGFGALGAFRQSSGWETEARLSLILGRRTDPGRCSQERGRRSSQEDMLRGSVKVWYQPDQVCRYVVCTNGPPLHVGGTLMVRMTWLASGRVYVSRIWERHVLCKS